MKKKKKGIIVYFTLFLFIGNENKNYYIRTMILIKKNK